MINLRIQLDTLIGKKHSRLFRPRTVRVRKERPDTEPIAIGFTDFADIIFINQMLKLIYADSLQLGY